MLKNWFLLASVSCGVGFGSTFLISRNLQQSTLAGLGTVPAVAASLTILSRQRREEIDRQVAQSKQQLQLTNASCSEISAHWQRVQEQEQLFKDRCREISAHGKELQTESKQLKQEVDRYRERQASLERQINSLVLQKQTRKSLLVQLDGEVLDKQKQLKTTQTELAQIQTQKESEIDSATQSNLKLQRIREEIRQDSAAKKQLDDQITDLDRLLQQKQSLLQNTGQQQQQSLQQAISDLLLQKQDQKILLDQLGVNISTKQNKLIKLDTEIRERQADLDKIAIDLVQSEARNQSAINSVQGSKLALTNIQEKIRQDSAIKEELKLEITYLQNKEGNLQAEIASHKVDLSETQQQISVLEEQREQISVAVNELNRSIEDQNSSLDDLNLEICNRLQVKQDIDSQIAELDQTITLFSGRKMGEALSIGSADLYKRWQQVNQQVSEIEDGMTRPLIAVESLDRLLEDEKAPSESIETVSSITDEKWEYHFKDNPHLPVLKHIDAYDVVTESEAFVILGNNGTLLRQFANRFRQYNQNLPFSIRRVEILNSGSRYVKENTTIIDLQNPCIISPVITVEPELDLSETERVIMTYRVCRFCGKTPSPCEDTCRDCN